MKHCVKLFLILAIIFSAKLAFAGGCVPPATPTAFNASVTAVTSPTAQVTLTWTATGADDVRIQISTNATFTALVYDPGDQANDGTQAINGFTCGTTYWLRIFGHETSSGGCYSGSFTINSFTVVCATCSDGILNQNETAIDCGGVCPACGPPNCADGVQNGDETGVDCGGSCPMPCGAETCSDNILNQNETAIDCGGVCPACGSACATYPSNSMVPAEGSIVDARAADQTITACTNISYNNSGNNWLHGVFVSSSSTGFVSSSATGAVPEANIGLMGVTYQWSNQTANFTSTNSGNSITTNGWFVETGALNGNPGNNLGWPVAAGTNLGPFCFTTTVSCSGLTGDVAAFVHFGVSSDSYSGAWTNTNCGLETSSGGNSLAYTLRCPAVMPIDLLYFDGASDGRRNKLYWATASETNNDHFMVYKSSDNGQNWKEMREVGSACGGNCNTVSNYEIFDDTPGEEITYYKIRQFDFDGNMTESKVIGLITPHYFSGISIIPNPVNELAGVSFRSTVSAMTQMRITNVSGKVVFEGQYQTEPGVNTYTIETRDFSNGLYFMELTNSYDTQKIRFVKE